MGVFILLRTLFSLSVNCNFELDGRVLILIITLIRMVVSMGAHCKYPLI